MAGETLVTSPLASNANVIKMEITFMKYNLFVFSIGTEAKTSIKLSLNEDNPLRSCIFEKEDYTTSMLEEFSQRYGERQLKRYSFKVVVPKGFEPNEMSVLNNHPGDPLYLAWFAYGNNLEEILESVKKVVDWIESGEFIFETEKYKSLIDKLKLIEDDISDEHISSSKKEELVRERDIIMSELEDNDLKGRSRYWDF